MLEFLDPWEPVWWLVGVFAITAAIYGRGLWRRRSARDVPGAAAFLLGLGIMYAVMQTRFDYYAQYMFFMHRLQHLTLHHLGPFLIALAAPLPVLAAGLPGSVRQIRLPAALAILLRGVYRFAQYPLVAGLLFVGLIAFWLIPAVHFDAMLSARQYWLMNLSMAVDGLLFWWLMLDPRPPGATPTTHRTGLRILVLWAVMPPQIAIGAWIALSPTEIFDVYDVCGRAWPLSPLLDQQLGGLITWIPAAMMSAVATLVLLRFNFRHDRAARPPDMALTETPA